MLCRSGCCGWKGPNLLFCSSSWEHTLWQDVGWDHSLCPLKPPKDVQLTRGLYWGCRPQHLGGDLGARKTGGEWYSSCASLHSSLCLLGVTHHMDPRDKFLMYLIRSLFELYELFCVSFYGNCSPIQKTCAFWLHILSCGQKNGCGLCVSLCRLTRNSS